jgi:hypothetical protein
MRDGHIVDESHRVPRPIASYVADG